MKKNRIIISFLFVTCLGIFFGCSMKDRTLEEGSKFSIVCTTFPQYDWVKQIIGEQSDEFELTLLIDNGVDLHNYQPTAEDIAKVGSCDIFIYVGGESDQWVEDALKTATNKELCVINLMDLLGSATKEEEMVEGMELEEEDEGKEEEIEYDEHIWLSLKNAEILVNKIATTIEQVDGEHSEIYVNNSSNYIKKLKKLDQSFEGMVKNATRKTVVFGDRFPFRYMIDDYGLDYYAAFIGCSAETEASFKTITFLAKKIDEFQLPVILVIEQSNQKIADTIRKNTKNQNQKILVMDSLQSVTFNDVANGFSYLKAMQDNLNILQQALN